jgi:hypothetical protein
MRTIMSKKFNLSIYTVMIFAMLIVSITAVLAYPNEQSDSSAYVGCGWNTYLPAFKDSKGISIPYKPTAIHPPIGYQGDFYVDEFTDIKIKQAWQELKMKEPETAQYILSTLSSNKDETAPYYRVTGSIDSKIANGELKLTDIRRPVFFGQSPYFEEIAKV